MAIHQMLLLLLLLLLLCTCFAPFLIHFIHCEFK